MDNGHNEFLTASDILGMDDIPMEEVTVPEWGNRKVWICGLTAAGKNAYQSSIVDFKDGKKTIKLQNSTAALLQKTLVDAKRQPLFTESQILQLGTKSAKVLERLSKIASRLSGMDEEEQEQIIKNSEAARTNDLPTV